MGLKLVFLTVSSAMSLLRLWRREELALAFFTAGLLNGTKVYVLAVIEHGTRRVRIPGATEHPASRGRCSRPGIS